MWKLILFICILASAGTADAKICWRNMRGIEGSLKSVNLPGCTRYRFARTISPSLQLKISIQNNDPEAKEFKVLAGRQRRSFRLIEDMIVQSNQSTDITLTKVKYIRFEPSKSAMDYVVSYEVIACTPPAAVKAVSCTNKYRRQSRCTFECGEEYLPLSFETEQFKAMCRKTKLGSNIWTKNLTSFCLPRRETLDLCLAPFQRIDKPCPYDAEDLVRIYNEDSDEEEPSTEEIDAFLAPPLSPSFLQPALSVMNIGGPGLTSNALMARPALTEEQSICKYHCARKGLSYYYKCGQLKKSIHSTICLRCRYTGTRCKGNNFILG